MFRTVFVSVIAVFTLAAGLCPSPAAQPLPQAETAGEEVVAPDVPAIEYAKGVIEGTLDATGYVLGAGDVLDIGFWGDVNRRETVTVNPDGDILIAPVGPIRVDGLTLSEVRELVRSKLSPYYRPDIMSVSLIDVRTFQIHVVGMVRRPGALEVNAVTRVSQAVNMAGGLSPGGSTRGITIRRGSAVVQVDLSSYLLLGDNDMNPFLRGGDIVFVPPVAGRVSIYGSVYRPGPFEFVEGESVSDLIVLAGGLRPEAYLESVEIQRFDPADATVSEAVFVRGEPALLEGMKLRLGDRVFVRTIPDWHRDAKVEILGEVRHPGIYVVEDGMELLSQVIRRAGGLTEHASLAEARLIRGSYRDTEFPIEDELAVMEGLENSFSEEDVDLIRAMGRERKGMVSLDFERIFLDREERLDMPLYGGDILFVPRSSGFVRMAGHVRQPGLVAYEAGKGYKHYIKGAGGFAPGADKGGARLIRAMSGQRVKPGSVKIRPGDIIWVPRREDRDWWKATKDIIQVLAQIATIYVVADEVSKR